MTTAITIAASAGSSWTNSSKESNSLVGADAVDRHPRALAGLPRAGRDARRRHRPLEPRHRARAGRRFRGGDARAAAFAHVDLDLGAATIGDGKRFGGGVSAPPARRPAGSWAPARARWASAAPGRRARPRKRRSRAPAGGKAGSWRRQGRWRQIGSCGLPERSIAVGCGHPGVWIQLSAPRRRFRCMLLFLKRPRSLRNSAARADSCSFPRAAPSGAATTVLPGVRLTTKLRRPVHPFAVARPPRRGRARNRRACVCVAGPLSRRSRPRRTIPSRSISSTRTSRRSSRRSPRSPAAIS